MKSKFTTYCGCASAAGTVIATFNFTPLVTKIALCVSGIATAVGLVVARDNSVTDERAGAK